MAPAASKQSKRPRSFWSVGLLLAWIAFIWLHSLMPGSASSAESGIFVNMLSPLLVPDPFSADGLIYLVRKTAHFSEYAILGALAYNALNEHPAWTWVLTGAFTAAFDEMIQLFVPERAGSVVDVGIDLAGFFTGVAICMLVRRLMRRRSARG